MSNMYDHPSACPCLGCGFDEAREELMKDRLFETEDDYREGGLEDVRPQDRPFVHSLDDAYEIAHKLTHPWRYLSGAVFDRLCLFGILLVEVYAIVRPH